MAKPLTRAQALENRAFLSVLRRTGNVRLACREVGLKYGTMQDRRRKHRAFAVKWDAALVVAQARLGKGGSPRLARLDDGAAGPSTIHSSVNGPPPHDPGGPGSRGGAFRTAGGEAVVVRLNSGKLQVRRAQPGRLTSAAEQAFLSALGATCNMSLAAAAVGACFGAFDRRRKKDPAFAREMRMALAQGWEALERALLDGGMPGSHEHDDWRRNDPPAMPPMTVNQALQLMYLHQKAALMLDEPLHLRRRRGESREAQSLRLSEMYAERQRRSREAFEVAEALRWERGERAWGPAGEDVRREWAAGRAMPDLAQVTGWSRADPAKAAHHPQRALFGGWRLEDMEEKRSRDAPSPSQS